MWAVGPVCQLTASRRFSTTVLKTSHLHCCLLSLQRFLRARMCGCTCVRFKG